MKFTIALSLALTTSAAVTAAEPLYAPGDATLGAAGSIMRESFSPVVFATPVTIRQQPQVAYSPVPSLEPIPEALLGQPEYGHSLPMDPGLPLEPLPSSLGVFSGLYSNVKVVDTKRVPPGAVPVIVAVPNPCIGECEPVYVEICALPHCEPVVKVGPRGQRVTFDYGLYRVQVTSLRGLVRIDYDN